MSIFTELSLSLRNGLLCYTVTTYKLGRSVSNDAYIPHNGHPRTTFKENISKLKNIHYELDMNMNIMDESRKEIN